MLLGRRLSKAEAKIAAVLSVKGDGQFTYDELAQAAGVCRATVGSAIRMLEALGLLFVDRSQRGANVYTMNWTKRRPDVVTNGVPIQPA